LRGRAEGEGVKTFLDAAIAVVVLSGTLGLVVARALVSWRRFRLQQSVTRLTEEGSRRLLQQPVSRHRSRNP
jgi:hypothetical protein